MVEHNFEKSDLMPRSAVVKHTSSRWWGGLVSLVVLVVIIGIGAEVWSRVHGGQSQHIAPALQESIAPKPVPFIPKNAAPIKVSEALASFNLQSPLPFFDEANIVQSLKFEQPASVTQEATTTLGLSTYVGYYIDKQSTTTVRSAYESYFQNIGWTKTNSGQNDPTLSFLSPDQHRLATVTLLEAGISADGQQKTRITVAFSMRSIQ